jgi:WD40 repeat protein
MLTIGHTRKGSCICGKFGGFVQVDPLCPVSGHDGSVLSVSFSPDGKRIVSGSEDCTVKIWSAETGAEVRHFLNISGFMWRGIRRFATPIPSPN